MSKIFFHLFILFFILHSFFACEESPKIEIPDKVDGKNVFVICEGNFMFANASISYYQPDNMNVENYIFYRTNGFKLGDVAQSMVIRDSLGFIVVNNSARIDVININTFKWVTSIEPLVSPRYIHFVNDSLGYITDLYIPNITMFNPQTFEITGHIATNHHFTEQMVQWNHLVFTNCWSFDNQVLVIDTRLNRVVDSIETGFQPQSLVIDNNAKLWVLTDGGYLGNPFGYERPELLKIDASSLTIEESHYFELDDSPSELQINGTGDTLYFINHGIYKLAIHGMEHPEIFVENGTNLFYALGVDPKTSEIYVADAIDHLQPGKVYRFLPGGQPLDTFKVGIVPGYFCFKQ